MAPASLDIFLSERRFDDLRFLFADAVAVLLGFSCFAAVFSDAAAFPVAETLDVCFATFFFTGALSAAADFFCVAFLVGAFFVEALLPGTFFFEAAFFTAAFFAGDELFVVFLAATFFFTCFFGAAFFGAAFLAAGFFLVTGF